MLTFHSVFIADITPHQSELHLRKGFRRETFFIVKERPLRITVNKETKTLGRGSVVLLLPQDKLEIQNTNDIPGTLYQMVYESANMDKKRGNDAGGSLMIDWNELAFVPNAKGGVRKIMDRPTTALNRLEMQAVQLNEGDKSHEPHQHKNDEMIIMLEGSAEVRIGEDHSKTKAGDVIFFASNTLHNLTNTGNGSCLYLAIQWR